jgi:hypothetical protein
VCKYKGVIIPVSLDETLINSLSFADDLVILSESQSSLQSALNKLENYCHKWQLTVNKNKTEVMIFHTGNTFQLQFFFIKNQNSLKFKIILFWAILLTEKEDLRDPCKNFQKRD